MSGARDPAATGVPPVQVTVNGAARDLAAGTTLAGLVRLLTKAAAGIAVAYNDAVVPRTAWDGTVLRDGDRVEVLTAVQGG